MCSQMYGRRNVDVWRSLVVRGLYIEFLQYGC